MDSKKEENVGTEVTQKKGSFAEHLVCGALAGLVSDVFVHPIDTCRTRLQVQKNTPKSSLNLNSSLNPSTNIAQFHYKNTFDAFYKIVSRESWSALYKGFSAVALFTVPAHALYFAAYETANSIFYPSLPREHKGPLVHFLSGGAADIAGAFIWTPQDVIKQRLQIQNTSSSTVVVKPVLTTSTTGSAQSKVLQGTFHAIKYIVQNEGFFALWRGFVPAIIVYFPFVGIYFACYEQSKLFFKARYNFRSADEGTMVTQCIGAGVASAIAGIVTTPMDVVKTRIQVGEDYKGWFDAVRRIWREEGVRTFGKGMGARVMWVVPGTTITMVAYEQLKHIYGGLLSIKQK